MLISLHLTMMTYRVVKITSNRQTEALASVLMFNVRFGVDTVTTPNRTLNIKTALKGYGWLPNCTQRTKTTRP